MSKKEQKAVLEKVAKLMSVENISVEHKKIPTAGFNIKTRCLYLPLWKDISESLYTLLVSHEVGHALYTTKEDFLKDIFENEDKRLKVVFNLVEDVRIEKMIQKKFPGIRSSFIKGYNELYDNKFFMENKESSDKLKPIQEYKFLDRINLHFKLAKRNVIDKVPFDELKEEVFVQRIDECTTFRDVLNVSKDLLEYLDNNNEEVPEEICFGEDGEGQEGTEKFTKKRKSIDCETQDALEKGLSDLIDNNQEEPVYVITPKIKSKDIIVSYNEVHKQIKKHYSQFPLEIREAKNILDKFKEKTKVVVSHMVQLFEMKKRAIEHAKSRQAKTGLLNMNKVYSYKFNEDIFKKITIKYSGKNHGMVMFIDMSGSMKNNMKGTIEQLLCLVMFCRKINIPFEVYGFTDHSCFDRSKDLYYKSTENEISFSTSFKLRNYFSSEMSDFQLNYASVHMMALANFYSLDYITRKRTVPPEENLNGTPLNETIISSVDMINNFRQKYSLDIVNTIFLTDGESTGELVYKKDNNFHPLVKENKIYIKNHISKKTYEIDNKDKTFIDRTLLTKVLLKMLKETCDTNIIGFYVNISNGYESDLQHIIETNVGNCEDLKRKFEYKKSNLQNEYEANGYIEVKNSDVYDAFYIIKGGVDLNTNESNLNDKISSNMKFDNLGDVFVKWIKEKTNRKVVLSKFIDHIS